MNDQTIHKILALPEDEIADFLRTFDAKERERLIFHWESWARKNQLPPKSDWHVWLLMAGRGFGKTRAGAEWIRSLAENNPGIRLALVAATYHEGRAVMIDGESGLKAIAPPQNQPVWHNSLRRLKWKNGAQALLYSAEEPEALRGPQHAAAWCDELAKWPNAEATWMNLQMGLRLGTAPRTLVTTTPRPIPLLKKLLADGKTAVTRGATRDNAAHLPRAFIDHVYATWDGTRLGRQELHGELIEDAVGALWTRAMLDTVFVRDVPPLSRVVVGVDPAVTAGAQADACGIIVAGRSDDGHYYVLADKTVRGASPETWARVVSVAAHAFGADRIVAEANNGGDLVAAVLRSVDEKMPVKLVRAARGKVARAEPVAALYERSLVHHAGRFIDLDDQLCGLMPGGKYQGPGKSPDRADALVWAISELAFAADAQPKMRLM